MNVEARFEANAQPDEAGKPSMRAFHNPAMFAEAIVLLNATACDSWNDSALAQMPTAACEVIPSILARLQSIWSCLRRQVSRAKCRRSQMPPGCQSRRRRQHVMPLPKPNSCGKSSHAIAVCNTNKMPFSAARSSTLGRPLFGEVSSIGSSGCNAFRNSLLIFFRAMTHGNAQQSCGDDMVLLAALNLKDFPEVGAPPSTVALRRCDVWRHLHGRGAANQRGPCHLPFATPLFVRSFSVSEHCFGTRA